MNGSLHRAIQLIEDIKAGGSSGTAELVVCPPSIYLMKVSSMLKGSAVSLGSQNVCDQASGAFTGEISAAMLKETGCRYAIVGHSERRTFYQESDELVAARYAMATAAGLKPILCVGESWQEREQGITELVIGRQLDAVIKSQGTAVLSKGLIAYEPVWAIGTGQVATPEQAQAIHAFIREKIAMLDSSVADHIQILYGGSMNPDNAATLLSQDDVDGGLIGGASLKAVDFLAIAQAA